MSKITRQKAAQLLGVSEQTISNYWKEGLLGGAKGKGNILYINEDDLNRLAHEYKMTEASERLLKRKQEKLREEREKVDEEMEKLRISCLLNAPKYFADRLMALLVNLCRAGVVCLCKREIYVLDDFLHGDPATEVAARYGLSVYRVQQIAASTMKKFENTSAVSERLRYYIDLEEENESLRKQLDVFKEKYEKDELMKGDNMEYITTLLNSRLVDLNLSVRTINALAHGSDHCIDTVDELTKTTYYELKRIRNLGRKSISEIYSLMDSLHLDFRRDDELGGNDEKYYKRMIKLKESKT